MKVLTIFSLLSLILLGCSGNELTVRNDAQAPVTFHFRGEATKLGIGGSITLIDMPNNEFQFTTIVQLPPGIDKSENQSPLSGTLSFFNQSTKMSIIYVGVISSDTSIAVKEDTLYDTTISAIYRVGASISSSDPSSFNPISGF